MRRRNFLKVMAAAVAFPFFGRPLWGRTVRPEGRLITGWPAFDEALGGGFRPGQLVVLKHDSSVNENWFLWNLWYHSDRETPEIRQFEPWLEDDRTPGFIARQQASWYRNLFPLPDDKLIISPEEIRDRTVMMYGQPEVRAVGGRVCDFYASVVIRAKATDTPGVVKYTITKNRYGSRYTSILVRHHAYIMAGTQLKVLNG